MLPLSVYDCYTMLSVVYSVHAVDCHVVDTRVLSHSRWVANNKKLKKIKKYRETRGGRTQAQHMRQKGRRVHGSTGQRVSPTHRVSSLYRLGRTIVCVAASVREARARRGRRAGRGAGQDSEATQRARQSGKASNSQSPRPRRFYSADGSVNSSRYLPPQLELSLYRDNAWIDVGILFTLPLPPGSSFCTHLSTSMLHRFLTSKTNLGIGISSFPSLSLSLSNLSLSLSTSPKRKKNTTRVGHHTSRHNAPPPPPPSPLVAYGMLTIAGKSPRMVE